MNLYNNLNDFRFDAIWSFIHPVLTELHNIQAMAKHKSVFENLSLIIWKYIQPFLSYN